MRYSWQDEYLHKFYTKREIRTTLICVANQETKP